MYQEWFRVHCPQYAPSQSIQPPESLSPSESLKAILRHHGIDNLTTLEHYVYNLFACNVKHKLILIACNIMQEHGHVEVAHSITCSECELTILISSLDIIREGRVQEVRVAVAAITLALCFAKREMARIIAAHWQARDWPWDRTCLAFNCRHVVSCLDAPCSCTWLTFWSWSFIFSLLSDGFGGIVMEYVLFFLCDSLGAYCSFLRLHSFLRIWFCSALCIHSRWLFLSSSIAINQVSIITELLGTPQNDVI